MSGHVVEAAKAAPSFYLGAWLAGFSVNEWAALAALVWTLLLIAEKLYRWWQAWRARK